MLLIVCLKLSDIDLGCPGSTQRGFRCFSGVENVCLITSQIKPPIGPNHPIVYDLDIGFFLGLVAGQDGIRCRLAFEEIEGFST